MPGRISGKVTRVKVRHGVAPRSRAASKMLSSIPVRRARTMMATKPIEKVMWAARMENRPSVRSSTWRKKSSNETPSRISGIATGVRTRKGRKRGRQRYNEIPAIVPSTVAIVLETMAISSEFAAACSRLASPSNFAYQRVVKPTQEAFSSESLNENSTTTARGT